MDIITSGLWEMYRNCGAQHRRRIEMMLECQYRAVSSVSASRRRKEDDPAVAGSSTTSGQDSWCHLPKVLRDSHLTAEPYAYFDFPPRRDHSPGASIHINRLRVCNSCPFFYGGSLTSASCASPGGVCSNQQLHPRLERDPQDTLAKHLVRRYKLSFHWPRIGHFEPSCSCFPITGQVLAKSPGAGPFQS